MADIKQITPVAILFVLAAIMLSVGGYIISQVPGSVVNTNSTVSNLVTDTNISLNTTANYTLSVTSNLVLASGSGVNSSGVDITSNLTFNYTTGIVSTTVNWSDANVSFNYYTFPIDSTTQSNVSISAQQGLGTLADWLPILAVVFMAVMLIGILVTAFRFKKE